MTRDDGWDAATVRQHVAEYTALGDAVRRYRARARQAEVEVLRLRTALAELKDAVDLDNLSPGEYAMLVAAIDAALAPET